MTTEVTCGLVMEKLVVERQSQKACLPVHLHPSWKYLADLTMIAIHIYLAI